MIILLGIFMTLNTIPLFGNSSIGYYYANVEFGEKRFIQSLIVDTGSSYLITDCDTC